MDFKASKKYVLPLQLMAASDVLYQWCCMQEGGWKWTLLLGDSSGHSFRLLWIWFLSAHDLQREILVSSRRRRRRASSSGSM